MISAPNVSVVMSAYNAEKYVGRAIESILNQTFRDYEFLIRDDASADNTLAVIEQYARQDSRVRIIQGGRNLQVAESLNLLVRHARSNLIARMDADDFSFPDRLRLQHCLINSRSNIGVVGGNLIIVDANGRTISKREYPVSSRELKKVLFRFSPFGHPVAMIRKDVFEEFGGYDARVVPCEDIDLWFKIGSKYDFASVPQPLLQYTLNTASNSHKQLRHVELLGLKVKVNAIRKYRYKPTPYDVAYNLLQYSTAILMPTWFRIRLYNFLRSRNLL